MGTLTKHRSLEPSHVVAIPVHSSLLYISLDSVQLIVHQGTLDLACHLGLPLCRLHNTAGCMVETPGKSVFFERGKFSMKHQIFPKRCGKIAQLTAPLYKVYISTCRECTTLYGKENSEKHRP